jgi:nicotinamide riboside kinase
MKAFVIALLGAESTGKTDLAQALCQRIEADTGLSCQWVPEALRAWCETAQRTPLPHEQAAIAQAQHASIEGACQQADVVVCDTTGLMTSVYSQWFFQDNSLEAVCAQWHRQHVDVTLLSALDLPWVPDGIQRDGAHVRLPVDDVLRQALSRQNISWSLVTGLGQARIQTAVNAVAAGLRSRAPAHAGLLTRLMERDAGAAGRAGRAWRCEHCDVPECEHQMLQSVRSR